MKKTVTINLSGQVFQIDEDAYEKLKGYLDSIQARFKGTEGAEDIIADIEARLAEMFAASLGDKKNVISIGDVEHVMQVMGKPEEFGGEEEPEETKEKTNEKSRTWSSTTYFGTKTGKKLYRDSDDKMLGGVLSGLSAYLGIDDPVWLRLATAILFFVTGGTVLLLYIILWIIVPKAVTASEKLEMRGEPINIDNIERTIREDIEDIKARINNVDGHSIRNKARSGFAAIVALLISIGMLVFRFIGRLVGLIIIVGIFVMGALLWTLFMPWQAWDYNNFLPYFFGNPTLETLAVISFMLVAIVPVLWLLLFGFRLLLLRRLRSRALGVSFTGLLIVGVILAFVCWTFFMKDISNSNGITERIPITIPANSVLHIDLLKDKQSDENYYSYLNIGPLRMEGDSIYLKGNTERQELEYVGLNIRKSEDNSCYLEKITSARGDSRNVALEKAAHITYHLKLQDSTLYLSDYLVFPKKDKIRCQMVSLTLFLPEGAKIHLNQNACIIIKSAPNANSYYGFAMAGHTWTMGAESLSCENCADVDKARSFGAGKQFTTGNFDKVKVDGIFEVHFHQGDKSMVEVSGPDDVTRNVEVQTTSNELNITANKNWLDEFIHFKKDHKIYVDITAPKLYYLSGSGMADLHLENYKGEELTVDLSGASSADLDVRLDKMTVDGTGACHINLSGSARELESKMSGASTLDALSFDARSATVEASGASHTRVKVSEKLNAEANGASDVEYEGSPTVSSDVSGFSSVKPHH